MRRFRITLGILSFAAVLLADARLAAAIVIAFDSLEVPGTGFSTFASYSEAGFTFTSSNVSGLNNEFASAHQGESFWYRGSAALFNNYDFAATRLALTNGGTFDFNYIALDSYRDSSTHIDAPTTVTFTGFTSGGGTVTQSVTTDSTKGFQTFSSFPGFSNLTSLRLEPFADAEFDNLNLTVPEPACLILSGGAAICCLCRRPRPRLIKDSRPTLQTP